MRRIPCDESDSEVSGCSLFHNKAAADLSSVPASTEACAEPQRLRKRRRITADKGKRQTRAGIGGPFMLTSILLFLTLATVAEGIQATTDTDVRPAKAVAASLRRQNDSARVAGAVGGRGREGDRQLEEAAATPAKPPTEAPTASHAPTSAPTNPPTVSPTVSHAPTISAAPSPQPSGAPSPAPSISHAPSTSHQPSSAPSEAPSPAPTSSHAPTVSPQPTTEPTLSIVAQSDPSCSSFPPCAARNLAGNCCPPSTSSNPLDCCSEPPSPPDDSPVSSPVADPPETAPPVSDPPETAPPVSDPPVTADEPSPIPSMSIIAQQDASCSSFPACAALELGGDCCPPSTSMQPLDCCSELTSPPDDSPVSSPVADPPETAPPVSDPPVTAAPVTDAPVTAAPVSDAPVTAAPVSDAPVTAAPVSDAPVTAAPVTSAPVTKAPTDEPTLSPIRQPTEAPVPQPTDFPTRAPRTTPVSAPVPAPVTDSPTVAPTRSPSTAQPIVSPPEGSPTTQPTEGPSVAPTASPTIAPTVKPTITSAPTISPAPSAAPTLSFEYDKTTLDEQGVRMILSMSSRFLQAADDTESNCTEVWRQDVQDRIEDEVDSVVPQLETLEVEVSNPNTEIDEEEVALVFDVLIEIRSPVQDHDVYRYIEGPFDTQAEKESFADFLRSTGCPEFASVGAVDVVIPKADKEVQADDDNSSSNEGLIAGIVLATVAILLLAATFFYVRLRNRRKQDAEHQEMPLFTGKSSNDYSYEYGSEIGMESNYEVSTLGDPIPYGVPRNPADSSTLGSQSLDYDYQKAYADAQSTTNSQVTGGTGSLPDPTDPSLSNILLNPDDDTFNTREDQFEVVAPAGLLGLILESNLEDGRPTVHNIKPNSVLSHVVKVGDRLLAVDNEDVSTFRASDVSRLIASKKDQKSRVLCFSRLKNQAYVPEDDSELE